jgi:hypothetical protein
VVDAVAPSLNRLAHQVLPGLAEKSPEEGGRPAYDEIGPTAVGLGTLADSFDQNGNFANLTAGLGEYNSQQFLPCTLDFAGTDLIVCQSLSDALEDFLGGSSTLLSSLAKRPGGASIYGPLLAKAKTVETQLAGLEHSLSKAAPAAGALLARPIKGLVK